VIAEGRHAAGFIAHDAAGPWIQLGRSHGMVIALVVVRPVQGYRTLGTSELQALLGDARGA
jgi:hypothetical protein